MRLMFLNITVTRLNRDRWPPPCTLDPLISIQDDRACFSQAVFVARFEHHPKSCAYACACELVNRPKTSRESNKIFGTVLRFCGGASTTGFGAHRPNTTLCVRGDGNVAAVVTFEHSTHEGPVHAQCSWQPADQVPQFMFII